MNMEVTVRNNEELNQKVQELAAQGYFLETNLNGIAIMKRKTYNTGILIILILFFLVGGIIYYLLSEPDVVAVRVSDSAQEFYEEDYFCTECGFKVKGTSSFCPNCGRQLK